MSNGVLSNKPVKYKGLYIYCYAKGTLKKRFISRTHENGFGIDANAAVAKKKARSEFYETKISGKFNKKNFVFDKYHTLPQPKIDIKLLNIPFYDFKKSRDYFWDTAFSVKNNGDTLLPASLIYFPFNFDPQPINFLQSTIGLSVHPQKETAIENGIFENFERHYFLRAWNNEKYVNRIATEKIGSSTYESFEIINEVGAFIICTVIFNDDPPYTNFGFGASKDFSTAFNKSKSEAIFGEYLNKIIFQKIKKEGERFDFEAYRNTGHFWHAFFKHYQKTQMRWRKLPIKKVKNKISYSPDLVFKKFGDIFIKDIGAANKGFPKGLNAIKVFIPKAITDYRFYFFLPCNNKYIPPV